MHAQILIEYNNKTIDKTFTYLIPKTLKDKIKVGMQVRVPINKRLINGFVLKISDTFLGDYDLKEIDSIVLENFVLNEELLRLGKYLKQITLCSLISAYNTMLPSSLKTSKNHDYSKYQTYIILDKDISLVREYLKTLKYPKQREILEKLLDNNEVLKTKDNTSTVKTLISKGLVKEIKRQVYRINYDNLNIEKRPSLTEEQNKAVEEVNLREYKTYLLYGVTGSGKTEVYMNLIERVIKSGKRALFLVPEISLTAQMIERFYKRFSSSVAIFHSGLSNGEKYDEYQKIYRGEVSIVVGTRSAIFTPLKDMGIIILDEEHSSTYKQDTTPKYNAIDIAKWRGRYNDCPVILGSATPLITDMTMAMMGGYQLISLTKRVGNAKLPFIRLVNMQDEVRNGHSIISRLLERKIQERLNNHEQIMLLLNRRGYSTTVTCSSCGFVYKCPYCDITLTYHDSSNSLRCHYCSYNIKKDEMCPNCNEDALNYLGLGTQKVEEELKTLFKEANIIRMDQDTTSKKGSYQRIIDDFSAHKYDILLGTQMISKGLDFSLVTLVGIINADTSLNIPDFRANEKTFSLLYQTSGRAGRGNAPGEVLIQTFNPDNKVLEYVKNNDYESFFKYELDIRHKLFYPPFCYIAHIMIISKSYEIASKESNLIKGYLNKEIKNKIILGPTPAGMFRINNLYHFGIIIKYKTIDNLFDVLSNIDKKYVLNKDVDVQITINPSRF